MECGDDRTTTSSHCVTKSTREVQSWGKITCVIGHRATMSPVMGTQTLNILRLRSRTHDMILGLGSKW